MAHCAKEGYSSAIAASAHHALSDTTSDNCRVEPESKPETHTPRQTDVVFAVAVRKIGGSICGDSRDAIRSYIDNNRWPLEGLGDPCTLARIPGPELIEPVLHV